MEDDKVSIEKMNLKPLVQALGEYLLCFKLEGFSQAGERVSILVANNRMEYDAVLRITERDEGSSLADQAMR